MKAKQLVLSRLLPKTGQQTIYLTGDDGTYEAGWWLGRAGGNNKPRYVAKIIDGDDVVIDRATGLMWAANGGAAGCDNGDREDFIDRINYGSYLLFAGFEDWRVPNIFELLSIIDYGRCNPAIDESIFPNTSSSTFMSSTTYYGDPLYVFTADFTSGDITMLLKTDRAYLRCVRSGV